MSRICFCDLSGSEKARAPQWITACAPVMAASSEFARSWLSDTMQIFIFLSGLVTGKPEIQLEKIPFEAAVLGAIGGFHVYSHIWGGAFIAHMGYV